ncbi:hypothetical protein CEXT_216191 [Caerostris extrusa]|uniref:EF-hand domain-containing protein n=1 Tax=Caerostris extrusa TaxID=172846 RepID=A0AAV4XWR5_CAEEX|nr:hypothetical protein CEXT_216191 [Caerostris extrusa]
MRFAPCPSHCGLLFLPSFDWPVIVGHPFSCKSKPPSRAAVAVKEVVELIERLDPNQHGVVTFADFCRGVQSTLQVKGINVEEAALREQQVSRFLPCMHS